MTGFNKSLIVVTILLAVTSLSLTFGAYEFKGDERDSDDLWLSKYEGREVIVLFDKAPWPIGKETKFGYEVKTELVKVESTGLVLSFGKTKRFFPYGHITSVHPER